MNYTTNDLTTTVEEYIEKGWTTPFPLPRGEKSPPVVGFTGNIPAKEPGHVQEVWEATQGEVNTALRMPSDVIALDVDNAAEFERFIEANGLCFHGGTVYNTRHGGDSDRRHWYFRVKPGVKWVGEFPGGEVVQMTHRYAVVYPSVVGGKAYKWYLDGAETEIPNVDDLPELPGAWQDRLEKGEALDLDGSGDLAVEGALIWLHANCEHPEAEPMPSTVRAIESLDFVDSGAHGRMRDAQWNLIAGALKEGGPGIAESLNLLHRRYVEGVTSRPRGEGRRTEWKASNEFVKALNTGVAKHRRDAEAGKFTPFTEIIAGLDWETFAQKLSDGSWLSRPEIESGAPENLEEVRVAAVAAVEAGAPEDYWQTQPVLAEIAHYATRAAVDKYSLLFRVLTYLSSEMPPTVYLEDIGQPLTLYSAVIAESGAGKGVLDKVADALVGQQLYNGDPVLRPGTGNMHTLLTALGDFTRPPLDKEAGEQTMPMKKHRMLIQGNELAAWAEMQGNAEWAGTMADVFDGRGDYQVRNEGNCYHFGVDQHSLAVTFSVQPDAARHLFASTGRGLPGRFLISALPPQERVLPEDFDPWDLDSDFEVDTFDPARDVSRLKINSRFFMEAGPFHLSDDARKANARLKRAWDEEIGEYRRLRAEKIFSQMPKVRLRVAVLLTVLLDLGEGREIPLEALKMADFLLKVSVENTRYARALAERAERKVNANAAATRKRAETDADLSLAKENVLTVIDKSKSGRAGLATMNQRKRATAEDHPAAIAELVAEGVLEEIKSVKGHSPSYRRV